MSYHRYSDDFKREAVRRVTDDGIPRKRVAHDLGISVGSLRNWMFEFAPAGPHVPDNLSLAEKVRLQEREILRLRQEAEILKKAVGIFSQVPKKK